MVRTRGGYLDSETRLWLPDDVGEIRPVIGVARVRASALIQIARAVEPGLDLAQRCRSVYLDAVHQDGLREVVYRHDHGRPALALGCDHGGQHPTDGADASVKRQFTQQHRLLQPPGRHLAVRRQHRGGQGEVSHLHRSTAALQ